METKRQRFLSAVAHRAVALRKPTKQGVMDVLGSTDYQWVGFREADLTDLQNARLIGEATRLAEKIAARLYPDGEYDRDADERMTRARIANANDGQEYN